MINAESWTCLLGAGHVCKICSALLSRVWSADSFSFKNAVIFLNDGQRGEKHSKRKDRLFPPRAIEALCFILTPALIWAMFSLQLKYSEWQ